MFTGIIEHMVIIRQTRDWVGTTQIRMENPFSEREIKLGDSLS